MPPIIFNAAALLQAIVLALVLGLLYLLNIEQWFDAYWIGRNIALYIAFFIASAMDVKGAKGRVFFLPSWLILLGLTVFSAKDGHAPAWAFWTTIIIAIMLLRWHGSRMDAQFKTDFQNAYILATTLQYMDTATDENKKEFWAAALQASYKPTAFYLFFHPLFRILYPNSVTRREFVAHYKTIVESVKKEAKRPDHAGWLGDFESALNREP